MSGTGTRDVPVGRRTMLADRRRLVVSVIGVGAAIGLVFLLQGLWAGFQAQISAYPTHAGADLFVAEAGTRNLLGDTSVMPLTTVEDVRSVRGVNRADPVVARFSILDFDGHKRVGFLLGSREGGIGGPWQLVAGGAARANDEVVLDRVLADEHGLRVGDRVEILGRRLRIVGLSDQTRSWMAGLVFVTHDAAEQLLGAAGTTSFVLVQADDRDVVAARIRAQTDLDVLTSEQVAANDRGLLAGIMAAPLALMVAVAFAAGTLIVALTVYSGIVERLPEYGIVKAMGASAGWLLRVVLGQTITVTVLGTAVGYVMFRGAAAAVMMLRPQFSIVLPAAVAAAVVASTGLMALLAGVAPVRRVVRLDPASVYRGGA